MTRMHRAGTAVFIGALAVAATGTAQAQIQGMPLFTNPRYATGFRLHADLGLPTDKGTSLGDYNVLQGGVTLALGPIGLGANVGATRNDFKTVTSGAVSADIGAQTKVTASALAQLRVYGGGASPLSVSLFGGASMDVNGFDFTKVSSFGSLPQSIQDSIKNSNPKVLTIPVGGAIGVKLPLVVISPNLWGSARLNIQRVVDCPSGATCSTQSKFRWAVGLDVPIITILSVRAAYDSGEIGGKTVSYFGVGASIGLGGMR
jgi:hypothetical protein